MPKSITGSSSRRRYPVLWLSLAVVALIILAGVLITQDRGILLKWAVFLSTDPLQGSTVFQEKGCIHCHAVNGVGGKIGPDLGTLRGHPSESAFLVAAMWNHAPEMWAQMRIEHFSYPNLTYEQAARLMAYLYMASHMDGPGDPQHGKLLFTSKKCIQCHAAAVTDSKPSFWSASGSPLTPMAWAQAMWANAPAMEDAVQREGMAWPVLNDSDFNDLFAYVRQSGGQRVTASRSPGDPELGWRVFQAKSCIRCHELKADPSVQFPNSRPDQWPAASFSQISELMWNDAPEMRRAMQQQGVALPKLTDQDMTNLFAFVFSLGYFDPPGSSVVGESIFSWRGCSQCHGENAQGSRVAPALRGQGRNYNSISLATALWSHGQKMYNRAQKSGVGWPTIAENDVGDLLAFLNSPTISNDSRTRRKFAIRRH